MKEITHKLKLLLYDSKKGIFENKVFSIVTLVGAITCFVTFVININILTENYLLINLVIALLGITLSIFFYLSAFKGITQPLIFPFQILVSLILVFSWFYFQGIEGSAPLFFFLAIFLLIYSDNRKRYWTISVSFIFLAVVLVGLYFVKHEWFLDYIDDESRIIDLSTSFIISFTAFSFTVVWLKKKFDLERARTQQKNIELKKSKTELQELVATKDKFFSIISHDLKIPFSGVIGFSELLIEKVQEKNYEKIESYARNIYNSSQQAMELLLNLLDWSRSQTGKIEFTPIPFEMAGLIDEVTELFTETAKYKSITISKELPENTNCVADRVMIATVLRNLISNAIKFTWPGGKIAISAQPNNGGLEISVSDNGVGMKSSDIEKLFRIEENFSTPGTRDEGGTGLGLLISKEFISKHRTNIRIESQPGKGSKFYFTVPVR